MTAFLDAVLKGRVMHMNKDGTLDIEGDLRKTIATLEQRVADLEAKLVERDVYEAQQILPPEQAALIKHLATVEQCIEEGPVNYHHAEESDCSFCARIEGHDKDCAWLALQFDRKPAETMALVEGWAWEENARRDSERARAMTPHRPMTATEASLRRSLYGLGNVRVETSPFVPPGTAYVFQPGAGLESEIALRLKMDEINGTGLYPKPDLGIPDTAVAPPDDEDVP